MKMTKKKRIIFFVFFAVLLSFCNAQKNSWTIGFYTGVQGQMFKSIERTNLPYKIVDETDNYIGDTNLWQTNLRTIHRIMPLMELAVQYKITDYFSLVSGIGYNTHIAKWKSDERWKTHPMDNFTHYVWYRNDYIQFPLKLQYDVPLKNTGFSFLAKLGMSLDFLVVSRNNGYTNIGIDSTWRYYDYETTYGVDFWSLYHSYPLRKINLLIHTGIGVSYQFNSGVGISLLGTYNIGILNKGYFTYNLKLKDLNTDIVEKEYDFYVYSRSESWNVLFGITYTFKKKEKKSL